MIQLTEDWGLVYTGRDWHLRYSYDYTDPKTQEVKRQYRNTFHPNLEQVGRFIVKQAGERITDIDKLNEAYTDVSNAVISGLRRNVRMLEVSV